MFQSLLHRKARTLITQARDEWFIDIQRLSVSTQKYYHRIINDFILNLPKSQIASITSTDLNRYLAKFSWGRKNSTTNKSLAALKSFFRFVSESYDIPNITTRIKDRKEEMPHQPFISREQYLKVLDSATQKESDIIKMLANLGLRCSELCNLKPENISPNLSSIRIQGKGGKVRTIPCNQTVREILSRTMNFPKNRKSVYNNCAKLGNRVNIPLAPHVLRRYFSTSLLNAGVSLLVISRLLGHSSVRTTEMYLKLDSSFLQGSTDCLD